MNEIEKYNESVTKWLQKKLSAKKSKYLFKLIATNDEQLKKYIGCIFVIKYHFAQTLFNGEYIGTNQLQNCTFVHYITNAPLTMNDYNLYV